MKKSELRKLIREEIQRLEEYNKFNLDLTPSKKPYSYENVSLSSVKKIMKITKKMPGGETHGLISWGIIVGLTAESMKTDDNNAWIYFTDKKTFVCNDRFKKIFDKLN